MLPRLLLLALCLLMSACASMPPADAPSTIPLPPVAMVTPCPEPDDLPDMATARELADMLAEWIQFGGCERNKRVGLLRAWPK